MNIRQIPSILNHDFLKGGQGSGNFGHGGRPGQKGGSSDGPTSESVAAAKDFVAKGETILNGIDVSQQPDDIRSKLLEGLDEIDNAVNIAGTRRDAVNALLSNSKEIRETAAKTPDSQGLLKAVASAKLYKTRVALAVTFANYLL